MWSVVQPPRLIAYLSGILSESMTDALMCLKSWNVYSVIPTTDRALMKCLYICAPVSFTMRSFFDLCGCALIKSLIYFGTDIVRVEPVVLVLFNIACPLTSTSALSIVSQPPFRSAKVTARISLFLIPNHNPISVGSSTSVPFTADKIALISANCN